MQSTALENGTGRLTVTIVERQEMSTQLIQAAQQALDALTEMIVEGKSNTWAAQQAVHDLRTAIQQAEAKTDEPAAWRCFDGEGDFEYRTDEPSDETRSWSARYSRKWEPLYTHPAPALELRKTP